MSITLVLRREETVWHSQTLVMPWMLATQSTSFKLVNQEAVLLAKTGFSLLSSENCAALPQSTTLSDKEGDEISVC